MNYLACSRHISLIVVYLCKRFHRLRIRSVAAEQPCYAPRCGGRYTAALNWRTVVAGTKRIDKAYLDRVLEVGGRGIYYFREPSNAWDEAAAETRASYRARMREVLNAIEAAGYEIRRLGAAYFLTCGLAKPAEISALPKSPP